MKVQVIFLNYFRKEFADQVKQHNFNNSGYLFDIIEVDKKGISAAINYGIQISKGYDAVVTMANDILMPDMWLYRMVEAATAIHNTGMCGIHCVEGNGDLTVINNIRIRKNFTAFGNVLIPFTAINRIGYFNPDYDPYGMQDADYAYRLNSTGFINYYIDGYKSEHIGHDVQLKTEYRLMKDEGLAKAGDIWKSATDKYDKTGDYTIFLNEYPNA